MSACSTLCDPYLNLFRGIIPPLGGTIDLSPILAFIALDVSAARTPRAISELHALPWLPCASLSHVPAKLCCEAMQPPCCWQTCALAMCLRALLPEVLQVITAICPSMAALSNCLLLPAAVLQHCSSPALRAE